MAENSFIEIFKIRPYISWSDLKTDAALTGEFKNNNNKKKKKFSMFFPA